MCRKTVTETVTETVTQIETETVTEIVWEIVTETLTKIVTETVTENVHHKCSWFSFFKNVKKRNVLIPIMVSKVVYGFFIRRYEHFKFQNLGI